MVRQPIENLGRCQAIAGKLVSRVSLVHGIEAPLIIEYAFDISHANAALVSQESRFAIAFQCFGSRETALLTRPASVPP
jgi:hypothetical protein